MKAFWMSAAGQLSVGLVLVAAVVVAFAVGGDATFGLVCAALVLAFLSTSAGGAATRST